MYSVTLPLTVPSDGSISLGGDASSLYDSILGTSSNGSQKNGDKEQQGALSCNYNPRRRFHY